MIAIGGITLGRTRDVIARRRHRRGGDHGLAETGNDPRRGLAPISSEFALERQGIIPRRFSP